MSKKVLLTGAAGMIGGELIRWGVKNDVSFYAVDDMSSGDWRNLKELRGEFHLQKDIDLRPDCFYGVDCIVHLAANTSTVAPDTEHLGGSLNGARHIIRCAQKWQCPLLIASSAAVYGQIDPKVGLVPEEHPRNPLNSYGLSKCWVEDEAKKYPNTALLRFTNVFGGIEDSKGSAASMVYQIAKQIKSTGGCRLFRGDAKRDFIFAKDLVRLIEEFIQQPFFGIFNAGSGTATSFEKLAKVVSSALKKKCIIQYFDNPLPQAYQKYTCSDISNALHFVGWEPEFSLEEGVKDYLKNL